MHCKRRVSRSIDTIGEVQRIAMQEKEISVIFRRRLRPLSRVGCTGLGKSLMPFKCHLSLSNKNSYAVSHDANAFTDDVAFYVVHAVELGGLGSLLVAGIVKRLPANSSRFGEGTTIPDLLNGPSHAEGALRWYRDQNSREFYPLRVKATGELAIRGGSVATPTSPNQRPVSSFKASSTRFIWFLVSIVIGLPPRKRLLDIART
jgi:hypothetical protein